MDIDTAQVPPGEPGDGSAAMAGLIGRLRWRSPEEIGELHAAAVLRIVGARPSADAAR